MAFKPIEILINAKDNASSVFDKLISKAGVLASALLAYFGVNAFIGVVKGAADFEQALSRVQAATGASKEEMAGLKKAAEDVGAAGKYSSVEAANALENLAKAGLNAKEAVQTLPAVLALAQAGDIELATSAELVTKAVMGMGLAFSDAGRVADVLALGANATNTSVLGLAQALSYAAPVAQSLGLSLESTVAIIGKFADAGIDAGRAGTALNSILSQFSDPASKFRNELAAAGITTGNFEKALHQLAAAGPAGAQAILSVGQEAGPALRALLNQGMGALDELVVKLKDAEGSAAATAAVMQNNLNSSVGALGKAWEYLTNTLGAPVLPVIKDAVDQLAASFRSAVADGTVAKFGEAIATAFSTGVKFIREFMANVDFDAVTQRMSTFADDTKAAFTLVGEYATNTGNTVRLAWGVMTAGANTVLAVIFKIGETFTEHLARIQAGIAGIYEAFSKITFGNVSKQYAEIAAEIRLSSEATAAAAEAMGERAKKALQDATDGADLARVGWAGLTKSVDASVPAAQSAAKAFDDMGKKLEESRFKTLDAQKATDAKKASDIAATDAIKNLRAEYARMVASGDLQAAADLQERINKALRGAKDSSKEAIEAAEQVKAAFKRLGVESTAELAKQAAANIRDYQTIKDAGTSTAEDLQRAFEKAAQSAIDANKGIAPSWVTAEAGVRGYKIVVDEAGKSHLELISKALPGLDRLARGWHNTREAVQAQNDAMDKLMLQYTMSADYTERQIALLEREAAAAEKAAAAYQKKWNMDKEGYSLNTAGERVNAGESQADVDKDVANRYGQQNVDNADAQRARQLNKMLQFIGQQGGLISDPGTSKQIADMRRELQDLEAKLLNSGSGASGGGVAPAKASRADQSGAMAPAPAPAPTAARGAESASLSTTVVFNYPAGVKSMRTDPDGATVIKSVLDELINAKGTSR